MTDVQRDSLLTGGDPAYDFPMLDPATMRDPYPRYAEMHGVGPIMRNPGLFGAWMVSGYDAALAVLTDHGTFSSSAMGEARDRTGAFEAPTMLNSDPPDHERLRGVVSRAFTPRTISTLEPRLREITAGLLEPLRGGGGAHDIVADLAFPLPVIAISELLGVPTSDRDSFREWSDQLVGGTSELASEEALASAREGAEHLKDYFRSVIAERRSRPGDDLVSKLVAANVGNVLDDAELLSSCVLLLVAGNETTTNLIANAALALGRHPDERRRLIDNAELVPSAVNEVMRYDSPVQATSRTALVDTEVAGRTVSAGEIVLVMIGAANRDPSRFDGPERLDVGRAGPPHIGFGHGIHFCLGASLARLEARLAIEGLLAAAPEYELADDTDDLDYGNSFIFHSPKRLGVRA